MNYILSAFPEPPASWGWWVLVSWFPSTLRLVLTFLRQEWRGPVRAALASSFLLSHCDTRLAPSLSRPPPLHHTVQRNDPTSSVAYAGSASSSLVILQLSINLNSSLHSPDSSWEPVGGTILARYERPTQHVSWDGSANGEASAAAFPVTGGSAAAPLAAPVTPASQFNYATKPKFGSYLHIHGGGDSGGTWRS